MCGILGFVGWDGASPSVERLQRATNLIRHRGPDGGGYWTEGGAFLGHRRLAIIDLSENARQPMTSASGRYVITFNGEIYNYCELRAELQAHGHVFRSSSDTEVILAGYEQWGAGVAARLLGMFAFGIFDRADKSLYFARDRFGEKPLLLREETKSVLFASELAPLAALSAGMAAVDLEALGGYLALNYVPGDRTMLEGVRRLPAGTWRRIAAGGCCEEQRYWKLPPVDGAVSRLSVNKVVDSLQERLDASIAISLRSDVPIGLFLSGGVDSSLVAESAARQGRLAMAFCVDMDEAGFSEWQGAERVANRLGLELERVTLSSTVLNEFLDVASHADDPLADSSAVAVWTVSRAAARRVKVVLSGDGGDELFGGYLTYAASAWHASLSRWVPDVMARAFSWLAGALPTDDRRKVSTSYKIQRFLRAFDLPTAQAHFTWNGTWLPGEAAILVRDPRGRRDALGALSRLAAAHALPDTPTLDDLQRADIAEYLPNDILTKVDRMTMAHGLESRAPLLDPSIASLAMSLPLSLRIDRAGRTKVLLRHLCARHFGEAHAWAPKQGFSIPIHGWLRGPGRPLVQALLDRDRVRSLGVLDDEAVARAVEAHLSGARALGWELWGLMVLVAWFEKRVATPPRLDFPSEGGLQDMRRAVA